MSIIKKIKKIASSFGFPLVGFVHKKDIQLGSWFSNYLRKGYNADMVWMEKNQEIRENPTQIEPFGKSFICLGLPYYSNSPKKWNGKHIISNYAWGNDYHQVIRKKLKKMIHQLQQTISSFKGRGFVDTAPIPEKILASLSGVGWIGKNSLLMNRHFGSYLFLSEILTNLDLETTPAIHEYCGSCTRCIDHCPTNAILPNKEVDSNRCISWLTIEKKGDFSEVEKKRMDYQLFGCDICQQVCPWNQTLQETPNSPFNFNSKWESINPEKMLEIHQTEFEQLKIKSPVKRAKLSGLKRNARAIIENKNMKKLKYTT